MKRKSLVGIVMAALMFAAAGTCDGTSSVPGQEILDLINERRANAGCPPVRGDSSLRAAADRHVVDMRDNPGVADDSNHLGSDGSTPHQRIVDAGYTPASRTGEIMYYALGPPGNTPQATVDWWMRSDDHRPIIETCAFTHAGVGLVYPGGTRWYAVVDFGAH